MKKLKTARNCPCESGQLYRHCCRPLHRGEAQAQTAEQLMRARYSAYVRQLGDYIYHSWAPETRPELDTLRRETEIRFTGLTVNETKFGAHGDLQGIVEFTANYSENGENRVVHERSLFEFREKSWVYLKPE